jgi:chaperone BCS1
MHSILTHFNDAIKLYGELIKSNPILAGIVALWGAGVATMVFRKTPANIMAFIKRQCTTTLVFTNEDRGLNHDYFLAFMAWFAQRKGASISRDFQLEISWDWEPKVGPGAASIHYFIWKGRLFWLKRVRAETQGTYQIQYIVTITMLGRSSKVIHAMIDDYRPRKQSNVFNVYHYPGGQSGWKSYQSERIRRLETVVVNKDIKAQLKDEITTFFDARQWYEDRGIPYKRIFMIHGCPGSGKTSLIKAMAASYGRNLCVLDLTTLGNHSLIEAINSAPDRAMFLIEDFDDAKATKRRKSVAPKPASKEVPGNDKWTVARDAGGTLKMAADVNMNTEGPPGMEDSEFFNFGTSLSGLLNALDGVTTLDDRIIFMTTNHPENIDPAVVRAGRVDRIIEVGPLTAVEVRDYIRLMFPDVDESLIADRPFQGIVGCDLQQIYMDHRNDLHDFLQSIPVHDVRDHHAPSLSVVQ